MRKKKVKTSLKNSLNQTKRIKQEQGITLIALVITTIFSYDEILKFSNNKGFLLKAI